MNIKELRKKTEMELQGMLKNSRKDLGELKFKLASKQLKHVREVRDAKKLVAHILTILNEKKNPSANSGHDNNL